MEEPLVSGRSDDEIWCSDEDPPWSPSHPEVRLDDAIAQADIAATTVNRATALQWVAIVTTLAEARRHPEVFLPGKPDMDEREHGAWVEFAVRAAVADLAVRLRMSESTVRVHAQRAEQLQALAPTIWALFRDGDISVGNATVVAELAPTLPVEACSAFDHGLRKLACELTTPRFREKARRLRETLDPQPLTVRYEAAREERRVWLDADRDGMCWMGAYLPADVGTLAIARLDATATSLAAAKDESRTMDQLRADIFGDLLVGVGVGGGVGNAAPVGVTVAVTVPVLTLLGVEELPGDLEGYGPIDAETARRLAARAPSFQRILTHPITGTVLDIDRISYRPPADVKRWTEMRDQRCTFAGCGRPAKQCDLDHRTAWAHGGATKASNLAHLCRHHHRLKHESKWSVSAAPTGATTWISPTGHQHTADPPPF